MSDSKDQKPGKPDPFAGLPDMDSTVRLDFGDNQNVFSTASHTGSDESAFDEKSPDEFDKTIDGLLDMEELLNSDKSTENAEEATLSFSTDDLNFNDLDAEVSSLSDSLSKHSMDADDSTDDDDFIATQEFSGFPPLMSKDTDKGANNDADKLDNLDDEFDDDDLLGIDGTVRLDNGEDEDDDGIFSATLNEPMDDLIRVEAADKSAESSPMLDMYDASDDETADLPPDPADELNQSDAPHIHLTKEMSAEPKQPPLLNALDKLDSSSDTSLDHGVDAQSADYSETIAETPGLTTTETNVLAGATAAIKEINNEERQATDMQPSAHTDHPTSAASQGGSNMLPMLIGITGILAGGFGAWMAFDANSQVQDLKNQLQSINPAHQIEQEQDMIDIQQRLVYIENRLAAAAASEQAAEVDAEEAATADVQEPAAAPETAPAGAPAAKIAVITPQTELAQARGVTQAATQGDWIVNVSSHTQEPLAIKEQQRLKSIGLNAEMHPTRINNTTWYRVQITGFETKDEAKAKIRDIEERSGIKGIWIGKR